MSNPELDRFLFWLKENNAEFEDIFFKEYSHNERGVHSKKPIKKGSIVIKIPKKLIIHSNRPSKYGNLMDKYEINIKKKNLTKLVLFMLEDMEDDDSFFKPYYDILPEDLSHMPIFWNDDELSFLENSHFLSSITDRRKILEDNYKELCRLPGFSKKFTFGDFCTVRTLVGSRNFGLNVDSSQVTAMVPLGDMFNHERPPDVKWTFEQNLDSYTMRANHDIKHGQAITDSYGKKSNNEYLLYYGFTSPDNDYNCKTLIDLDCQIDNDPDYELRKRFIDDNQKYFLDKNWNSIDINRLLSQLRIINANIEELHLIIEKYSDTIVIPPLSKRNEKLVLQALLKILKKEKDNYGTELGDNLKQLKNNLKKNQREALNIVVSEKNNIKFLEENIKKLMKHLLIGKEKESPDSTSDKYLKLIKLL
jgi:hypothetical protein